MTASTRARDRPRSTARRSRDAVREGTLTSRRARLRFLRNAAVSSARDTGLRAGPGLAALQPYANSLSLFRRNPGARPGSRVQLESWFDRRWHRRQRRGHRRQRHRHGRHRRSGRRRRHDLQPRLRQRFNLRRDRHRRVARCSCPTTLASVRPGATRSGNTSVANLSYACMTIPAGCGGTVTCACASSLCPSQHSLRGTVERHPDLHRSGPVG